MMSSLDGRVALVTGGTQGIGAAHARLLAANGAHVAICDVADAGAALAAGIGGSFHHLDVTDADNWAAVVADIAREVGAITVLINNAGVAMEASVVDTQLDDWNRVMAVNVTGTFLGIRAVAPQMEAAGGGGIVNISSSAGLRGVAGLAAYCTSKWAVRGLTKAAALDLAGGGIRVASVHPGLVLTPMSAAVDHAAATAALPIPRAAEPDEIARMSIFFLTEATYSTGCELVADGGRGAGV